MPFSSSGLDHWAPKSPPPYLALAGASQGYPTAATPAGASSSTRTNVQPPHALTPSFSHHHPQHHQQNAATSRGLGPHPSSSSTQASNSGSAPGQATSSSSSSRPGDSQDNAIVLSPDSSPGPSYPDDSGVVLAEGGEIAQSQMQNKNDHEASSAHNANGRNLVHNAAHHLQASSSGHSSQFRSPQAHTSAAGQRLPDPRTNRMGEASSTSDLALAQRSQGSSSSNANTSRSTQAPAPAPSHAGQAANDSGAIASAFVPADVGSPRASRNSYNGESHHSIGAISAPSTSIPSTTPTSRASSTSGSGGTAHHFTAGAGIPLLAGYSFWSDSQDQLLAAIIQRRGLAWREIQQEFQESSKTQRSLDALKNRWRKIARHPQPTPQITAAIQAADAYVPPVPPALWTAAELEIVRRSLAQKKRMDDVCADYESCFPNSDRNRNGIKAKAYQLLKEEREANEEGDEAEGRDGAASFWSEEEGKGEDEIGDVTMADLPLPAAQRGSPTNPPSSSIDGASAEPPHARHEGTALTSSSNKASTRRPAIRASTLPQRAPAGGPYHPREPATQPRAAGRSRRDLHAWSKHDDALLLSTLARFYSGTIQWEKATAHFNRHSDKKRTRSALHARWHAQGYKNEDARKLAQGLPVAGSESKRKPSQAPLPDKDQRRDEIELQTFDNGAYEGDDFSMDSDEYDSPSPLAFPAPTHPQSPSHAFPGLGLNVKITYLPEGVQLDGVFPGLEIKVFSPTCVKITTTGQDTAPGANQSFDEVLPAFDLRCVEGEGVQAVVVPPGSTMSATLVKAPPRGLAAGVEQKMTVQTSVRGPDGFLVLIS